MKLLSFILSFLFCSTVYAQQETFRAHVVDALTNESLPYAQIYVSAGKGTLTNEDGDFSITVNPGDVLRIS